MMDLWEVSEMTSEPCTNERVGYLTSMTRDEWADAYKHLSVSGNHEEPMKVLADSLLVVCLDEDVQNCSDSHR